MYTHRSFARLRNSTRPSEKAAETDSSLPLKTWPEYFLATGIELAPEMFMWSTLVPPGVPHPEKQESLMNGTMDAERSVVRLDHPNRFGSVSANGA